MKRVLMACVLAAMSSATVFAQTAKKAQPAAATQADPKAVYVAKVSELDAALGRGNKEAAQQLYMEVVTMMMSKVSANNQQLQTAKGKEKTRLEKDIELQNNIYRETKMMSPDMIANRVALIEKLKSFQSTL